MSDHGSLFDVDLKQNLQFFLDGLTEVGVPKDIPREEVAYVASMFAHHSMTSNPDPDPKNLDLEAVYKNPVLGDLYQVRTYSLLEYRADTYYPWMDPTTLEEAGGQALVLVGFFQDQMRRRHNLSYAVRRGRSFFNSAGEYSDDERKQELLFGVAGRFLFWTETSYQMSRNFRENSYNRYLFNFNHKGS